MCCMHQRLVPSAPSPSPPHPHWRKEILCCSLLLCSLLVVVWNYVQANIVFYFCLLSALSSFSLLALFIQYLWGFVLFVCLFLSFMEMVELIYNDDDEKEEQQKQQQKIPPLCAVQRVSSFASLPVDLCSTRLNNRLSRSSSVSIRLSTETLSHRSEQSLIPKWVVGPDWSCSLYTLSAAHDVHFRRLIAVRLGAEKKSK